MNETLLMLYTPENISNSQLFDSILCAISSAQILIRSLCYSLLRHVQNPLALVFPSDQKKGARERRGS
jgi:hypothetical protein